MTPPIEAAKAGTADGPQPRKKERLMLPDCGGTMWKLHLALLAALAPALFAPPTMAQQGAAEALTKSLGPEVIAGCQQELTRYCDAVTPGEGRLLACLFAHEDRLSGRCDHALPCLRAARARDRGRRSCRERVRGRHHDPLR
jgi:hypothetical protein